MTVIERPPLSSRLRPWLVGFDIPLMLAVLWMCGWGLLCMYSAGYDHGTRFVDHARNMLLGLGLMFLVGQVPPQKLMALAIPLYTAGRGPADRHRRVRRHQEGRDALAHIGITQIQPSELLKIATPLMLAWWFQKREGILRWPDFVAAFGVMLLLPFLLIAKQPDLGTGILVLAAGPVRDLLCRPALEADPAGPRAGRGGATRWCSARTSICQPDVKWPVLKDYQKHRICTLLDPSKDPLGKGFHIIQGEIAIGSGGI